MNVERLQLIAARLASGDVSIDEFFALVDRTRTESNFAASIDLDRERRCGYPEVVYGESKTVEQLEAIIAAQQQAGIESFCTRVAPEKAAALAEPFPQASYNAAGRTLRVAARGASAPPLQTGRVVIITAGTTDFPVAEEARETLRWMGFDAPLIQDVGVAGPHRLLARLPEIRGADAVVVVAGMEGALPSVVGGHVDCPVIAVPTSVGYGAAFGGLAALLGMLNSCASNVSVVNIDAGFKAAYVAGMIARRATSRNMDG